MDAKTQERALLAALSLFCAGFAWAVAGFVFGGSVGLLARPCTYLEPWGFRGFFFASPVSDATHQDARGSNGGVRQES